jgi:hypothetical protein
MATLTTLRANTLRRISRQLTTSKFAQADIDIFLNKWYRELTARVMLASGFWEFDGEMFKTDLVSGQIEYVLKNTMVNVNRVEVLYPNATNYVLATRIDDEQTRSAIQNGSIDAGSEAGPVFREFNDSIFVYPAPTATVSNGLAVEAAVDLTDLSAGGDIPNLNILMHECLVIGAAQDYCETEEMYRKAALFEKRLWGGDRGTYDPEMRPGSLISQLEALASKRDRTEKTGFRPRVRKYN